MEEKNESNVKTAFMWVKCGQAHNIFNNIFS